MTAYSAPKPSAALHSLLARQAVFTDPAVVIESGSTLVKADASVFHPLPNSAPHSGASATAPEGYDAGFAAGQAQSDRVFRETLTMMEGVLATLKADIKKISGQIEESHSRSVRASLRAVLPAVAGHSLRIEIAKIMQEAGKGALGGQVEARIHPENHALLTYFKAAAHADIRVTTDVTQSPTGLAFTWAGGGEHLDPVAVAAHCLSLIGDPEPLKEGHL